MNTTLKNYADNQENEGRKAIHMIANDGNLELLEELIQNNVNLDISTPSGMTMLHIAAINCRFSFVKRLLEVRPDMAQSLDANCRTALHYSAIGGDIQVYREIEKTSKSSSLLKDNGGFTTLHLACSRGHFDLVKYILGVCPETVHITSNSGRNAIHSAVQGGDFNILDLLVSHDLSIASQDKVGDTCLTLAVAKGDCCLVSKILHSFPEIKDIKHFDGTTALHIAASHGHVSIFKQLAGSGLCVDSFTEKLGNCLHVAVGKGQIEMVRYILSEYSHLSGVTTAVDKWTVSLVAVAGGHIDMLKFLIRNGYDLQSRSRYGGTAYHIAVANGDLNMVQYLMMVSPELANIPRNDGWTPIHLCAVNGRVDILEVLINAGASVKETDINGDTCFHIAASNGKYEIIEHIVNISPALLHKKNNNGYTALQEASKSGNVEAFKSLVKHGASTSDVNCQGETCLHTASLHGKANMISYLLVSCPELLSETNNDGWTALHAAASKGHIEACKSLITAGLSLFMKTKNDETVKDIAKRCQQRQIIDFLKQEDPLGDRQITPLEEEDINAYISAFDGEMEERRNIRLTVVGYEEVGKTTFCWRLMNKDLQSLCPSGTDGMDIYINRLIIDMETKERTYLETGNDQRTNIQRRRDAIIRKKSKSSSVDSQDEQSEVPITTPTQMPSLDAQNNINKELISGSTNEGQGSRYSVKKSAMDKNDVQNVLSGIDLDAPKNVPIKAYASIWDCGGHKEFYNSHHIFLSSDAIYILVFDVSKCLSSKKERRKVKFWLESIQAHSAKIDGRIQTPPIIMIGTHLDKIQFEDRKEVESKMRAHFEEDPDVAKLMIYHTFGFFLMNTLTETEETFERIWDIILDAAKYQSQWEKQIPTSWLLLEKEISSRRIDGCKIMTHKEVESLWKSVAITTNEVEEVSHFLRYFHLTGEILYFSDSDEKFDVVVINPQWIIHAFRRLITAPQFEHCGTTRFKMLWDSYKKSAVIGSELISLAWQRDTEERFLNHKTTLLYTMERLGLIASPPEESIQNENRDRLYFVPAMLQESDPNWLEPIVQMQNTKMSNSICFVFKKCIPFTILDKLIAFCVQKFNPFSIREHDTSNWLQRGLACFKATSRLNLILCCKESVVKATLFKLYSESELKPDDGYNVRIILEETIEKVLSLCNQRHLKYDRYLHIEYTLSVNETRVLAADLEVEDEIPCTSHGNTKILTKRDYEFWFVKQKTLSTWKTISGVYLPETTLGRQLQEVEMAKIANVMGAPNTIFFVELGLKKHEIERIRAQYSLNDIRDKTFFLLKTWNDKEGNKATIQKLLMTMMAQDIPTETVISCIDKETIAVKKGIKRQTQV